MSKLQLSKSSLAREVADLATYKRFLPSLDLKRKQLMMECGKAKSELENVLKKIKSQRIEIGEKVPMLANENIDLTSLVTVTNVDMEIENIAGTKLPVIKDINLSVQPYSCLAKPHWVDVVTEKLQDSLHLRIKEQVMRERLAVLTRAQNTITQRVNLFDKVLIPKATENIKQIKIYLSDEEMAAVVRSKIAKRKRVKASM
jgi:V/A-type H+/Na+-transporting ATPase subunit D